VQRDQFNTSVLRPCLMHVTRARRFDASVLPCWLAGLVRRLAELAHCRLPEMLDASMLEAHDASLMRLCSMARDAAKKLQRALFPWGS